MWLDQHAAGDVLVADRELEIIETGLVHAQPRRARFEQLKEPGLVRGERLAATQQLLVPELMHEFRIAVEVVPREEREQTEESVAVDVSTTTTAVLRAQLSAELQHALKLSLLELER